MAKYRILEGVGHRFHPCNVDAPFADMTGAGSRTRAEAKDVARARCAECGEDCEFVDEE